MAIFTTIDLEVGAAPPPPYHPTETTAPTSSSPAPVGGSVIRVSMVTRYQIVRFRIFVMCVATLAVLVFVPLSTRGPSTRIHLTHRRRPSSADLSAKRNHIANKSP